MSAAVMKNPIEHAMKHAEPCHQRPKGRANPTARQERRLRKNVKRLAKLVAEGKVEVEVTPQRTGLEFLAGMWERADFEGGSPEVAR